MDNNTLWSLRLGFTGKQASAIKQLGIENFLKKSFTAPWDKSLPPFLSDEPKTLDQIKIYREKQNASTEGKKQMREKQAAIHLEMKAWWIEKMIGADYPLREKMTVFLHNHYVAPFGKTRINYWVYAHNMVLRENAFGNLRELTKKAIYTNNLLRYLDNNANIKGSYNENLSRELLELFTLGIGNYTEQDIKNGALGLAGLTTGDNGGRYIAARENNEAFEYLGRKGNFKAGQMVDIIFEQPAAPYHFTRKILKWFIYDNPPEKLVKYYGDYFRAKDFEMQPFLIKLFTEELNKPTAGSKIKDPLLYILQLADELNIDNLDSTAVAGFIKNQGMDLYNQTSVKGWDGGTYWLATQTYLKRHSMADMLCKGLPMSGSPKNSKDPKDKIKIHLDWSRNGTNKTVIRELKDRLLFTTDEAMQADLETILKYDFDPKEEGAENGVIRLFNYIVKTPEYKLI